MGLQIQVARVHCTENLTQMTKQKKILKLNERGGDAHQG